MAREIGFVEDFGLADDRKQALSQLIPGTEDYYYYQCLQAQHTGATNDLSAMLDLWIKRYGYTARVKEIRNRQALFDYEKDPAKSLGYIRTELGLAFDHRRVIADQKTDFPTRLDPAQISMEALTRSAFARYNNLQGIEDVGLDSLAFPGLDPTRRRDLLSRLQRPDVPGLAKLVVDDLNYEHSGGFGSLPIHNQMLAPQLEECARLMPALMDTANYINAAIAKFAPSDDVDMRFDPKEKKAFIDRLVTFTRQLAPAYNSLKAHALYQLLDLNRRDGKYDPDLFMEYVKLPRNVGYINPDFMNLGDNRNRAADLNASFQNITRLPPVGVDEPLVRDYLGHFFVAAPDYTAYVKYIRDDYLKDVFVETKIVNGVGDMEQWYSMLPPSRYQALK